MTSCCRTAVLTSLLPLLAAGLVGCHHKAPAPAPPVATAPPLPPSSMTQVPTVPPLPAPTQPQVGQPLPTQKAEEQPPPPPPHVRRSRKHPAPSPDSPASTAPVAASAATATAAVNPATSDAAVSTTPTPSLGQLSAGGGVDNHERAAMSVQIHTQEVRLGKIKHPLSEEDEALTKQVEAFLTKARQAALENDLDGAQTLTTKAKVLLDELPHS